MAGYYMEINSGGKVQNHKVNKIESFKRENMTIC